MSIYLPFSLFAAVISFYLGAFALSKAPQGKTNRLYFLCCIILAFWLLSHFLFSAVTHGKPSKIYVRKQVLEDNISILVCNDGIPIPIEQHAEILNSNLNHRKNAKHLTE